MCDKELLVGYLYDEIQPAERARFDAHLRTCAACRREVEELRHTRTHLAQWAPPEPELGFEIVRAAPRTARRFAPAPAWALAAAAALVLAASAAIANLEVRYDGNGLVVRTGWAQPAGPAAAPASLSAVPAAQTSEEWRGMLQLLDERLRQLEVRTGSSPATLSARADESRVERPSDADLIRRVRQMIAESDARHQRELALRVTQMWKDVEAVRASDLSRVEQGLRQIQGLTNAELIQHRDTLNYLVGVAQQRQR
jgi:anti-sigma factor RsiW